MVVVVVVVVVVVGAADAVAVVELEGLELAVAAEERALVCVVHDASRAP